MIAKPSAGGGDEVYAMHAIQDRLAFRVDFQSMETTGTFTPGEWIHVTMVYDGVDKRIYLNGILDPATPQPKSDPIDASTRQLYIGRNRGGTRHFDGQIDEVRIFDVALSAPQVALLANPAGVNFPPQVDAGADETIRLLTDTVNLDGTVTDDGLPIPTPTTTWTLVSGPAAVTFGDTGAVDTTATFSVAGTYVLRLEADDSLYQTTDTLTVTVEAVPMLATIVVSPPDYSLAASQMQQFTAAGVDQYGDPIATVPVWSATGGSIDTAGLYTSGLALGSFTITATDGVLIGNATMSIIGSPPTANAGGPYLTAQGVSIPLDGSASGDPNGDIVEWNWDFDNDGQFDDATGETPQYTAILPGIYTVDLQVRDAADLTSMDSATVTVTDTLPAAPTGVGAAAGNALVTVDWAANTEPDLAGYRVHRSTSMGGPYTDVSGLTASLTFADFTVTNGVTYYYVVTAEDATVNTSPDSTEVSATPELPYIPGDINDDGVLDAGDLLLMERHLGNVIVLDPMAIIRGDLYPAGTGDGQLTISDLLALQQLLDGV